MGLSLGVWGEPQSQVFLPWQKAQAGILAHIQSPGPMSRFHPGGLGMPIPHSGPQRCQLGPIPGQGAIAMYSKEPFSLLKL